MDSECGGEGEGEGSGCQAAGKDEINVVEAPNCPYASSWLPYDGFEGAQRYPRPISAPHRTLGCRRTRSLQQTRQTLQTNAPLALPTDLHHHHSAAINALQPAPVLIRSHHPLLASIHSCRTLSRPSSSSLADATVSASHTTRPISRFFHLHSQYGTSSSLDAPSLSS